MAETPIGDLVLFEDDERVDAVDVRALQVLVYQCIADAFGGLMGETSGVLGGVTFDTSAGPTAVGVGECTLCGFKRVSDSSARVEGLIMHYNPNSPFQIQKTLPATLAAYSSSDRPFIWFARAETPAERATRKKFSAGAERTITPMTRLRQNVLFGVTATADTTPDDVYEWHVFARVTAWSGGSPNIPTIRAYRPWDIGRDAQSVNGDLYYPGRRVEQINVNNNTPYLNGLPRVLTYLAQVLALTRDNAMEFASDGSTVVTGSTTDALPLVLDGGALKRGTKQLDDALTDLDERVVVLEENAVNEDAVGRLLHTPTLYTAVYKAPGVHEHSILVPSVMLMWNNGTDGTFTYTFSSPGPIQATYVNVQVSLQGSAAGFVTYEWISTYVLRVYVRDSAGVLEYPRGYSLTISNVGVAIDPDDLVV